ncbi:MAG TPA: FMN-binding protein [Acidimicrobiales bacterium]|nr:FMN-binding protein [Acidimicrobiales bacterium]
MKRAPIVVSGTLVGLVGLFSFHSKAATLSLNSLQTGSSNARTSTPGTNPKSSPTTSSSPAATPPPPTSSTSTISPAKSAPGTTAPTTTAHPTTTTAPPSVSRTGTGPVTNYFFGTVSVSVTVSGKKITNISIASLNDGGNPRSQQIDQYALPQLEQQALAANGANIQGVSGATYTSQGFVQSLQGALSKVGL